MPNVYKGISELMKSYFGVDINETDSNDELVMSVKDIVNYSTELLNLPRSESQQDSEHYFKDRGFFFQQLFDTLPDYIYFKDKESRFIFCNPGHLKHLGLSHMDEIVGKTDADFFKKRFAVIKLEDEKKIIETGKGWFFKEEHHFQQGGTESWVLSTKLPLYDRDGKICGIFGLSRDITEKKLTEIELERQRRLMNTIIQILPCRLFVRDIEGKFVLVNEEYKKQLKVTRNSDIIGKTLKECFPGDNTDDIEKEDREVLENNLTIVNKIGFDQSILTSNTWITTSKVPLKSSRGKTEGLVGITMDISEQKEAEQQAKEAFSALSLRTKQMEAELDIARNLQERLMSEGFKKDHSFKAKGKSWLLSSGYLYQPSHHLAGDFFHLIPISKSKIGILICDVMGHGVKAALVTMLIRGILIEANPFVHRPGQVLTHLNKRLVEFAQDPQFPRFTTAIYLVVDLSSGKIRYSNAGHPEPIFLKDGKMVEVDNPDGMGCALGLIEDEIYKTNLLPIESVDRFALLSDGILETTAADGSYFTARCVAETLAKSKGQNVMAEMMNFETKLKKFSKTGAFDDDICLLVFDLEPRSRPN